MPCFKNIFEVVKHCFFLMKTVIKCCIFTNIHVNHQYIFYFDTICQQLRKVNAQQNVMCLKLSFEKIKRYFKLILKF